MYGPVRVHVCAFVRDGGGIRINIFPYLSSTKCKKGEILVLMHFSSLREHPQNFLIRNYIWKSCFLLNNKVQTAIGYVLVDISVGTEINAYATT